MAGRDVQGVINYLGDWSGKPAFHAQDHAKDTFTLDPRQVAIEDARGWDEAPSLDREGFALARWPTAVKDFENPAEVRASYGEEIEALIKDLTGASRVLASGMGVVRWSERSDKAGLAAANRPARFVHADYTDDSAAWWVRRMVPEEEAERLLAGRYAVLNIWRVLTAPPQDAPLALCDARSVARGDEVVADAVADFDYMPEQPRFDASLYRFNRAHRWTYVSDMTPDEVLVFKGFDSDASRGGRVPHCAFQDATCPSWAPARMNVDTRAFAFFD